jgi:hypothetical protein
MKKSVSLALTFSALSMMAQAPKLELSETGEGSKHQITVTSSNLFKMGFENNMCYGATIWYDLVNDPDAKNCITKSKSGYITRSKQGALINQVLMPKDFIAHIESPYHKKAPRSIEIVEKGSARVIIRNKLTPLFSHNIADNLSFLTTYTIYPTGRIYVKSTLLGLKDSHITLWRNSTITMPDPTYNPGQIDSGTATEVKSEKEFVDSTKKWKKDSWKGLSLSLPKWTTYEIVGNNETTLFLGKRISGQTPPVVDAKYKIISQQRKYGWLRADSEQNPHSWHRDPAEFLFMYWDKSTPAPFTEWTKASIMLVPRPKNPKQGGGAGLHGWKGTKRLYYQYGKFDLAKDEKITQFYMIQLGTENSKYMPNIRTKKVGAEYANDYRTPATVDNGKFDWENGCYIVKSDEFNFKVGGIERINPAFQINDWSGSDTASVSIDGKALTAGKDFTAAKENSAMIIQLFINIKADSKIIIK